MNCIIMTTNDQLRTDKKICLKNNSYPENASKVMEEHGIHPPQTSASHLLPCDSIQSCIRSNTMKKMTAQNNVEEKNPLSPKQPSGKSENIKRPFNDVISPDTKRLKIEDSRGLKSTKDQCSNSTASDVPQETHTKTCVVKDTAKTSTMQASVHNTNCINSFPKTAEQLKVPLNDQNKGAQSSVQLTQQKSACPAPTVTSSSSSSSNSSGASMVDACTAPSTPLCNNTASSSPAEASAPITPGPQAPSEAGLPSKSKLMSHLKAKYLTELEYMLREFRKLERQLLGAKGHGAGTEESAGSRERREKLHSFILHLEDTIRQIEVGCGLEAEGKSTVAMPKEETKGGSGVEKQSVETTSSSNRSKEEEDNIQKLEEHIKANLLPVKVRLIKQLAAQQGATKNPIGMPVARRGLQPSATAHTGQGTFAAAAEERRKQAEAAREEAEESLSKTTATPSQFGNKLAGNGSSLTQKLHGSTLGSEQRKHGDGVGSIEPPSTKALPANDAEVTDDVPKRKILYGGMAPGSKQILSGVSAASGAHKMIIQSPELKAKAKGPPANLDATSASSKIISTGVADQAASCRAGKRTQEFISTVAPKSRLKPHEDPSLSIEERRKLRKERRKRKKARDLRRREKERQRQLFLQQQASQTVQPKIHGKKVGKAGIAKGGGKKKGPRSVEYICALCSEVYTSTCEYNPWWALASHECPKCRKNQIPRIDITAVANQIEYHPALLAHAEEGSGGGGGGMATSTPAVAPMSAVHHVNPSHPGVKGYQNHALTQNAKLSCYPASDSEEESDLSELSDAGDLSDASLDDGGANDDTPMTDGELAELELFGKEYEGPKLTPDHASRLLVLMAHAQTCPGRHKSVKHRDCCNSVKYMMLHVRDCPGTTSTFDVCPFPWCRKIKHLMYHLVACPRPKDCAICSPMVLSNNLENLIGLNNYRRQKHKERMKAVMAAAAAAAKAKPPPAKAPFVPKAVKPTAYRPNANQKKNASLANRAVKNSRPVSISASRVTQISRNGTKGGPVTSKLGSKGCNGVVVKSLVKPVGKSSMVVVNGRPQRTGQPKQVVSTIQRVCAVKPEVSTIPELAAARPTVAALPGVEELDPSFSEAVSSEPGSAPIPIASISATAPVLKSDAKDKSNTVVSATQSSEKVCSVEQVATSKVVAKSTDVSIDSEAGRPVAVEKVKEIANKQPLVHNPLIRSSGKCDDMSFNKNCTNYAASRALAVDSAEQKSKVENLSVPKVNNMQEISCKETQVDPSQAVANASVAEDHDDQQTHKDSLTTTTDQYVVKTEAKESISAKPVANKQKATTDIHSVENNVTDHSVSGKAAQAGGSSETALQQSLPAANVQSEIGSISNPQHAVSRTLATPNTIEQIVKRGKDDTINTEEGGNVLDSSSKAAVAYQPAVVANLPSETGSGVKNPADSSVSQLPLTVLDSKKTTKLEVKELIPTSVARQVSETKNPLVVVKAQLVPGSAPQNASDHPVVPQTLLSSKSSETQVKVEEKRFEPTEAITNLKESQMHQPLAMAVAQPETTSIAEIINEKPMPADAQKNLVKIEVKELVPNEAADVLDSTKQGDSRSVVGNTNNPSMPHPAPIPNSDMYTKNMKANAQDSATMKVIDIIQTSTRKETLSHDSSALLDQRSRSRDSMMHVTDHPAPKAALAVNAIEQAAKVAMETSIATGMNKTVQAEASPPPTTTHTQAGSNFTAPGKKSDYSAISNSNACSIPKTEETHAIPARITTIKTHGEMGSNLPPRFPEVPAVVKEETAEEAKKEVPPV